MSKKTTSFALDDDLGQFVREQVESGEYASASEVVRTALTEHAERVRRERAFYAAIDEGLTSPRAEPGVWSRIRRRLHDAGE